jgi:hypothetical protein
MKVIKGFKLTNVVLISALALAGCGDDPFGSNATSDPSTTPTPTVDQSGKVADGYLNGATVCLDLNDNKTCDDGEPTATSTDGGSYAFKATQNQINATPLLVQVTDTTIDEDYPEKTLTPYTLSAPAGYTFVSPLTTMIQNIIEKNGSTASAAEKAVQELLGTTLPLDTDYIAGKSDAGSEENQASFDKLHKVAQVTARLIAESMADPTNEDFNIKDLSSAIIVGVLAKLEEISEQVDDAIQVESEGGDAFDPDILAEEIDIVVEVIIDVEEYVLISSTGAASELTEDMVIGEWSTGSQINAESNHNGLAAWTITSAVVGDVNDNNWGTVLSLSGGFVGDFSEFDQLKLKIATSGGYAGGYFIKISTNGVVSADIPLSVNDSATGWQDIEVDLANYDLSSIESIAIFAIGGEANVSKIHIADLALGQDDSVPDAVLQEYALISSTGAESKINENTEVGEWSTGSQINGSSNYEGLDAWSLTAGSGWGTVLALTGGFDGDFGDFDTLRLKIATSGGYAEGYFVNIKSNGVESGNIALSVSDGSRGWQDADVDLSEYDLSSIEFIAVFAIGGTENVSQLHIADLALVQLSGNDTGSDPVEVALEAKELEAATFVEAGYTTSTWVALTTALAMPETTQAEIIAKTEAITTAIAGLEEKEPVAVDVTALSAAIIAAEGDNLRQTGIGDAVGQASQSDWQTFFDAILAAGDIRDTATDQTAVNQEIIDLAAAEVVFNESKVGVIVGPDPVLEEGPNLIVNGDFTDTTIVNNGNTAGIWSYYSATGSVVAIADGELTADVTTLGGQWENQIWNIVQVSEEGAYVAKFIASSTVDRDILFRIDGIEIAGAGPDSDVICHLTSTPTECTLHIADTFGLAGDPRLKIVLALGALEAAETTSVASTVIIDDFYLGTLTEAVSADKMELETAIATAQVLHDGGEDETLKAAYQIAINTAQAAVDDADLTQTEADGAVATLAIATGEFDPSLVQDPNNLVVNGNFADTTLNAGAWSYYTSTGTVVAISDRALTADVTTVGGQWDNQIWNEVQVTEEGNYKLEFTASSTVERDILIRVDAIEMNGDGTTGPASDILAHLTTTPQTFTKYVRGIGFAGNPRFKIVTSVGGLEAAGTTSVASTVTYHDVYLGTFEGELPTDTGTLGTAITLTQNMLDTAVEGTEEGQYDASKADLQTAIDAAQAVVDNVEVTQAQADAEVTALAVARTTFEAGFVVPAIPGAQIATATGDINYTPDSWGTGTAQDLLYTGDATYSSSIQLVGNGAWGTVLALTGIPAGVIAGYDSIDFKIKTTDFTEINVKIPTAVAEQKTYALTTGTALADGWVQMSIPVTDFGNVPATSNEFAIFGPGGTGIILLTDISFSNVE